MPLPDPFESEPVTQVDPSLVMRLREAKAAVAAWTREVEALTKKLIEQVGSNHAGMVGEDKVFTYRPTKRWATSRLMSERGDLTQHFMRQVVREELNLEAFASQHPEVLEQYQVRQFVMVEVIDE